MKDKTMPEKALSIIALFALFAVPLAVFSGRLYPFISSKSFLFMGLAELAFFLWVYLAVTNPMYRLSKKTILAFLVPLLLLASLTISAILAPIPNLAFWGSFERGSGLIFLVHCVIFGVAMASLVRVHGKEFLTKAYKIIFYSGIILALSTFINEHIINIPSLFLFSGPNSADLLGNSSFSGGYLIFALFLGILFFIENRASKNRLWILVGLLIILASPILLKARGATLGIFTGAVVAGAVLLATHAKKSIRAVGFAVLGLMLVGGVWAGANLVKDGTKLNQAFIQATTNSRLIFWGSAVEGIQERPAFGWGQENFTVLFSKNFDPAILEPGSTSETWTDKPHNSILEAFTNGGFVGGILYLVFALMLLALPAYLYRKNILNKPSFALLEGMFVAYFLQALVLFDTIPSLMMLFALFGLLAGGMSIGNFSNGKRSSDTEKSIIGLVCLALFIVSWVFFIHNPLRKSKAIIRTLDSSVSRQENFAKLLTISPMGNGGDVAYIASVMMSAYRTGSAQIMKDPALVKSTHEEIQAFLKTVDTLEDVANNNARLWLTSGELMNFDMTITNEITEEKVDRAFKYLARAEVLAPENPRVYWMYGQLYLHADDYKKAYESYKKAYDINPKVIRSQEYVKRFEEVFGSKI